MCLSMSDSASAHYSAAAGSRLKLESLSFSRSRAFQGLDRRLLERAVVVLCSQLHTGAIV
jgi:hypothetical protein